MKPHEVKTLERRFLVAILLTGSILAVEVVGSWWTGSLALISDAAHVFLDIFALGLSWLAIRLSSSRQMSATAMDSTVSRWLHPWQTD